MFSPPGIFSAAAGTEQIVLSDPGFGTYKKLVIADGRLAGAVLFGDTADSLWYLDLIRSGRPIAAIPQRSRFRPRLRRAQGGLNDVRRFHPRPETLSRGLRLGIAGRARRQGRARGGEAAAKPIGPDAIHFEAQDRVTAAGGKLADQEKFKREQHPFDAYDAAEGAGREERSAEAGGQFPLALLRPVLCRAGADLVYVPAADSERHPLALAIRGRRRSRRQICRPFSHVTTRANLQIREIEPKHAVEVVEAIQELGLCSRGSGADNIRNVTGTPTAGIDPQELIDTRPHARAWHHHILNERALYGLPRKFNVAFDGAGIIPVLEDTNDIGFQAVEVKDGFGIEPGIWYRLALGGITGHRDFARDTGFIVKPAEAVKVADAIVRVFIEHGDRTNRNKARLKYVLDAWGFEKFMAAVEDKLGRKLVRAPADAVAPRPAFDRSAHIGVHPQKQAGLNWIGLVFPAGKITTDQMRGIAKIAHDLGDGDIRLTVWQNLLISGVQGRGCRDSRRRLGRDRNFNQGDRDPRRPRRLHRQQGLPLLPPPTPRAMPRRSPSIARRASQLDSPVNIHLTGCHHSCAQHYIGDIGLIGARVATSDEGDTVDGYHILVGGGFGPEAALGREIYRDVKADAAPQTVERMLKGYLANRVRTAKPSSPSHAATTSKRCKTMFGAEAVE